MKNKILILILGVFLLVAISGIDFDPGIVGEFIDAGAELIEGGILEFDKGDYDVGVLIGDLEKADISVSSVRIEKKEDVSIITFLEDASVSIKGDLYENLELLSSIKLYENGSVKEAYLTADEGGTSISLGGEWNLLEGQTLVYKDGKGTVNGKSIEYKPTLSEDFLKIDLLGETLDFEKDLEGNSIFTGDFKIGENEFKGLSEEGVGKITLSNRGEVIGLGENTQATIDKIIYQTSERGLFLAGDANNLKGQGKNYFISQEGEIKTGGMGFTVNLQEGNSVFPELDFEEYVYGSNIPKTGNFEIIPKGGDFEITKSSGDDLINIDGEGLGQINNGRVVVIFDEDLTSGEQKIMTKTDSSMGLAYNLNLNNGQYVLEDFVFKGNDVEVSHSLPWENTLKKSQRVHKIETTSFMPKDAEGIPLKDEFGKDVVLTNTKNVLLPEFQEISDKIEEDRGIRPRRYDLFIDDARDQDLVKWAFEDTAWINKNNEHGIIVSPEEVAAVSLQEYFSAPGARDTYYYYKDSPLESTAVGLDFIGNVQTIASRKEAGFFHPDLELLELNQEWVNELGQPTTAGTFKNMRDGFAALVGEYGYRKYQALETYKDYYGEEALNKLTESQKTQLAYYTYNCGLGCLQKAIGNVNEKIFKPWEGEGEIMSARHNSQMLTASVEFLRESGLFNSP